MSSHRRPKPVTIRPWTWHHDDSGEDEFCAVIANGNSQVIIPADQLRPLARYLLARAAHHKETTT